MTNALLDAIEKSYSPKEEDKKSTFLLKAIEESYTKDDTVNSVSTNSPFKDSDPPVNYETDRPPPQNRSETKLSITELTQDEESVKNIRRYMKERYGYGSALDDEEVVDKFINHMRSFHGGNSITTLSETAWITSADDQQRAIAGMAYGEFDKLGNIFSNKASWAEMFDGIYDYGWAAIVDPVNIIGFGAGKLAGAAGSKAASKTILELAKKASQKKFGNKAVSDTVKNKFEKEFIKKVMQGAKINKKPRRIIDEENFSTLVNKYDTKKKVKRELLTATGADAAISVGIDVAYQGGLIKTMQQEDFSLFQSGLAALGSLVSGGLAAGSLFVKSKSKGPSVDIAEKLEKAREEGNLKVGKEIGQTLDKTFKYWAGMGKVAAELTAKKAGDPTGIGIDETSFWKTFLLGVGNNPNAPEIRGLVHNIKDAGLVWEGARYEGDNWTNWIADIIKNHGDISDFKTFINRFNVIKRQDGKAFLPNYEKALDDIAKNQGFKKGTDLPEDVQLEFFANRLSMIVSNNAELLNALSQGANITRAKNIAEIDPKVDAKELVSDLEIPSLFEKGQNTAKYVQSTIIRNIVTHPGTTALNLTGWSAYSGLQSATDIIKTALYSPKVFFTNKMTKEEKAKYFSNVLTLHSNKVRNLLDPETTIESFNSYLKARPEAGKNLMRYLAGGVEQTESFKKQFGFDPNENMLGRGVENYTNFFQTVYGVKAQDVFTKSVEYMYNIEKQVMRKYGVTFDEFLNRKDLASVMSTDDYLKIEAKAVDDTLRSVFSKRYGAARYSTDDLVGSAAKAIEDFRKIPVLGLAMPFGQFFNNTLDFMSDMVGGGALRSAVKYFRKTADGQRLADSSEVADATIKAGIFWSTIGYFAEKESRALEEGLGMFEERDENTGRVRNMQYDYPYSLWKGMGRAIAHLRRDGSIPPDVNTTLSETFGLGQFSRQLGQYTNALAGTYRDLTEGNLSLSFDTLGKLTGKITAQAISGTTRALDPINQAVGMAQGDDFVGIDRRQGIETLNKSLRYVDNIFIGGMKLLDKDYKPPEKFKTTSDIKQTAQPTRLLGFREVPKSSDIQKMFNSIGRPEWRSGIFSKVAEADNRINELIFPQLEQLAGVALRSSRWKEGTTEDRIKIVAGVMQVAKQRVSKRMQSSPIIKDRRLDLMFKISNRVGKTKLDRYLKEFVGSDKLEDLSLYQLNILDGLIKEDTSRNEAKRLKHFY